MADAPTPQAPRACPRGRNRLLVPAIAIGIFAVAAWIIWPKNTTRRAIDLDIPEIDLTELERGVVAAITDAVKNIRDHPDDPEAWGRLGCVYQVHEMRQPARASYERAIELDADEFRWHYFQSVALLEDGDPAAIKTLQRAIDLRSQYAPALFRLGDELSRANRLEEARTAYQSGLDHSLDDMHGLLGLARLAGQADELDEAMQFLTRAEAINAGSRELQSLLARVHQRQGNRDAARAAAARAAEASQALPREDPVMHEVLSYGASAYWNIIYGNDAMKQNQFALAERYYVKAVESRPEVGKHYYNLGFCLEKQEKLNEAVRAYQAAIERDPGLAEAHSHIGQLASRARRRSDALHHLREAIHIDPNRTNDKRRLAALLATGGQCEEALTLIEELRRDAPDDLTLMQYAGTCLVQLDRASEGLELLEQIAERTPDSGEAYLNVAIARMALNDLDGAEEALQRAETAGGVPPEHLNSIRQRLEQKHGPCW